MRPLAALDALLDLLAPRRCPGCDAPHASPLPFCDACAPLLEPAFASGPARGLWRFQGPLSEAVRRLKYHDRFDLAAPLAELMWRALAEPPALDVVVPVPLHQSRLRERGYNQSALLARGLARRLGARLRIHLLRRTRATLPQVGQTRAEREDNVRGAFAVARSRVPARVLVVDDVRTSGATLAEACDTLRRAGAQQVYGLALAQADEGGTTPA